MNLSMPEVEVTAQLPAKPDGLSPSLRRVFGTPGASSSPTPYLCFQGQATPSNSGWFDHQIEALNTGG